MNYQTGVGLLCLVFGATAQAQTCNDAFKSRGNFLSGTHYSMQLSLAGVPAAQAFDRLQRFTADNGFTVQSAEPTSGQIHAVQSAQLAKGKRVPLDITVRDEGGTAVIDMVYATGPGQMSPEAAVKAHFCKSVAAAQADGPDAAKPVAAAAPAQPAATPPAMPDSEVFKNGQPCMSGLCIGDTVAQIPKSIQWESQNPALSPVKRTPTARAQVDAVARVMKGPRSSLEKVAAGFQAGAFNAAEVQALGEVQAVCAPLSQPVMAYFKSASGHPTHVRFLPGMNDAGQLQFRVSELSRYYSAAITVDQQKALMAAAEQQYGDITLARKMAVRGANLTDTPTATIKPGALLLIEAGRTRDAQGQAILKHPACGGAAEVKLD